MIEPRRILAPTDFSAYSTEAMEYACSLVEKYNAELHLLHVLEMHASSTPVFAGGLALTSRVQESREAAEKELLKVASGHDAIRTTVVGPPFLEILRYARDNEIDLIVMGTHGRSGLAHVLVGSVAERVVRKSSCPVLTVRHPKHEFVMPFDKVAAQKVQVSPEPG
jgi:nucleotide-binding universal stress UspA family protein